MKKGLILEGGALRDMFTCGVMDVMMENGITFDGAIGVSAGACFGVNYKSHQNGRALRYNLKYCSDDRYGSFKSFMKTGNIFDADFCYHVVPTKLDLFDEETYINDPMEFICVATDVNTGEAVYHEIKDASYSELEWIRASAAMPVVSQIVEVDGYQLLDGSISDSIPLKYFEERGYDRNVVILTRERGYLKEKNKHLPLIRQVLKNYPHIIEAMESRHYRYNKCTREILRKEKEGEIFVFAPEEPLNISATETKPRELIRVYELGRVEANKRIDELKSFLENK